LWFKIDCEEINVGIGALSLQRVGGLPQSFNSDFFILFLFLSCGRFMTSRESRKEINIWIGVVANLLSYCAAFTYRVSE